MLAPTLLSLNAFDANNAQTFTFTWSGDQAYGSRLIIKDNITNAVVLTNDYTSMKLENVVNANQLSNGVCYNAVLYIKNINGDIISASSNPIIFYCYSTPLFEFSNLTSGQIISNSYINLQLNYEQNEGEQLQEFVVKLYSLALALEYTTDTLYTISQPVNLTGLTNNTSYYVQATGTTVNGMKIDTGKIQISVEYLEPTYFSIVGLESLDDKGYVELTSNFAYVNGTSVLTPQYVNNTSIDLITNKNTVTFSSLVLPDAFRIDVIFNLICLNVPLLTLTDGTYIAQISYITQTIDEIGTVKGMFKLTIDNGYNTVTYLTDYFTPIDLYCNSDGQLYAGALVDSNNSNIVASDGNQLDSDLSYSTITDEQKTAQHHVVIKRQYNMYSIEYMEET